MKEVLTIDIDSCIGCHACVAACIDKNYVTTSKGDLWRGLHLLQQSDGISLYLSLACMHCMNAPCVIGCPTGAISVDEETGHVRVKESICIGCFSCSLACPFGIPTFDAQEKMQKCNLCEDLIEEGYMPACVAVCPTNALKYGPVNELSVEKIFNISSKVVESKKVRWP